MKIENLQFLAQHLSVQNFILVYLEQKEEYHNNNRVFSRSITQKELEQYIPNPTSVRRALYRLKDENLIKRVGRKEWQKTSKHPTL
jgi:hypothetical protein